MNNSDSRINDARAALALAIEEFKYAENKVVAAREALDAAKPKNTAAYKPTQGGRRRSHRRSRKHRKSARRN